MRIPLGWLKDYVDIPVEPARLAEDLTVSGLAVDGFERDGDDIVLELDVTTNRVDCMNVFGVAREVAVLYGQRLRAPACDVVESGPPASEALQVEVAAPDLCGRFAARVLDVRMGSSPAWLQRRLAQVGVRAISNVVDLTNYVMLELGQPSHVFDLERVPAGLLRARWALAGERLVTLDGQERVLDERCGVVASPDGPLALAGIMGGASSEVRPETRLVALEAAWWEPLAVRRAARALGMHTDASHRFERAADFEGPYAGIARLAHLLVALGCGSVRPGLIDVLAAPRARRVVNVRPARVDALLGLSVPAQRRQSILTGLGFELVEATTERETYGVPSWRNDVAREVDVIEEVGRHHGLAQVPALLPSAAAAGGLTLAQTRERALRETLIGAGLREVLTYAFVDEAESLPADARIALANPLAEQQAVLRSALVFPGLLSCARTNLRQGRRELRLFEIGRVFVPQPGGAPREDVRLGVVLAGHVQEHWSERPRLADLFDLKGLLELLWARLGLVGPSLRTDATPAFLHPGRAARLEHAGRELGWLGALAPAQARAFECRDETLVAEFALDTLLAGPATHVRSQPLARYPGVTRDLSLVCTAGVSAAQVERDVRAAAGPLLADLTFRDRYSGAPLPPESFSLTLGLRYQHAARTLTGEEVQASVAAVAEALRAGGIEIRGE
jgi:phenylalanyl-tRNA synthetase beta chain